MIGLPLHAYFSHLDSLYCAPRKHRNTQTKSVAAAVCAMPGKALAGAVCLCLVLAACSPAEAAQSPRRLMGASTAPDATQAQAQAQTQTAAATKQAPAAVAVASTTQDGQMYQDPSGAVQQLPWRPPGGLPGTPGGGQGPGRPGQQPPPGGLPGQPPYQPPGGGNPYYPPGGNPPPYYPPGGGNPYYPPGGNPPPYYPPGGGNPYYPPPCGGWNQPPCQPACGGYNQPPCCGGYNQPPCNYYPPGQYPPGQYPPGQYPPGGPYYPYDPCACVNNQCVKSGLIPNRCSLTGGQNGDIGSCTPVGGTACTASFTELLTGKVSVCCR
ncbi:hypothetical protein OEZ86_006911 [Tetradesmus obliquus]|nr:hypothetical protein OEZ86_006911 [Tetradesmus obliquus]